MSLYHFHGLEFNAIVVKFLLDDLFVADIATTAAECAQFLARVTLPDIIIKL